MTLRFEGLFLCIAERSGCVEHIGTPMPTEQKAKTIEAAKDWYSRSKGVVFTDYRGLSVKEFQGLRKRLKAKGGEIHVIKNTLFRQAIGDDANNLMAEHGNGPTAVAFLFDNETTVTKELFDFATASKKMTIKGGLLDGKPFDTKQMEAFSKLPSKEILISQVIGTIVAPLTNLVGVVEALYADPIRVIGAVADKVAEGSPLPAPKAQESTPSSEAAPAAETDPASETAEPAAEEAPAEAPVAEADAPSESGE